MPRADRLFRLLQALRRLPAPVTAARLATETEVSLRSLYRDIAALRAGGALIDGAPGLGYTLTEDPALPPQTFTRIEVEALVLGLSEVTQLGDPDLALAARDALAKITATPPERIQRQAAHAVALSYRPRPASAPVATRLLREAAWEERAVDILYADKSCAASARRIWPLAVVHLDHALICLAWCCLRGDFRQFRLDRIQDLGASSESFRPRRAALLRDYIARLTGQV